MEETAGSLACPMTVEVPIRGGQHTLVISPWSMELHDLCFPIVAKLLEEWVAAQSGGASAMTLGQAIMTYKTDVSRICQLTVKDQLDDLGLTWGKSLYGEDLFGIAEGIWKTSIVRGVDGGLLGKAMALMGPTIWDQITKAKEEPTKIPSSEPKPKPAQSRSATSKPPVSLSSLDGGAAPLDESVAN